MVDRSRSPQSAGRKSADRSHDDAVAADWTDPDGGAERRAMREQETFADSHHDLRAAVDDAFAAENLRIAFVFDRSTGRFTYRGHDRETGMLVREYTSKEVIDRLVGLRILAGTTFVRPA